MSDGTSNPARYFGRQVRGARRAAGWTLAEFGQRIGYDPGQISRIENGKRPPTELFAQMCDRAFPDRDEWFSEFYAESRTWIATPPWFRSWIEHEQRAAALRIWQLGVLSGLLQTEDYARAILTVNPGVTEDEVSARLAARLARQAILTRDDPLRAWFLVDEAALRRFAKVETAAELLGLWKQALEHGEIAGPYWALLTHPVTDNRLVQEVFGDVHMLSHLVGAANRADIRRFNTFGDVTYCKGTVSRKYVENGVRLVDVEIWAENQRGEITAPGLATVLLPSRDPGSPIVTDGSAVSLNLPTIR